MSSWFTDIFSKLAPLSFLSGGNQDDPLITGIILNFLKSLDNTEFPLELQRALLFHAFPSLFTSENRGDAPSLQTLIRLTCHENSEIAAEARKHFKVLQTQSLASLRTRPEFGLLNRKITQEKSRSKKKNNELLLAQQLEQLRRQGLLKRHRILQQRLLKDVAEAQAFKGGTQRNNPLYGIYEAAGKDASLFIIRALLAGFRFEKVFKFLKLGKQLARPPSNEAKFRIISKYIHPDRSSHEGCTQAFQILVEQLAH